MKDRIEIEKADNGYSLRVWNEKDKAEMEDNYGYHEPKIMVATSIDEALEIIKKNLK